MIGEHGSGKGRGGWRALGKVVPQDHILRRIDRFVDLEDVRDALRGHYSARGRPSIAPDLLIRMLLIGRLFGITSERRLCDEVRFNLAYRWFSRMPSPSGVWRGYTFVEFAARKRNFCWGPRSRI